MRIDSDVPLKDYTTMRIGEMAKALTIVHTKLELIQAVAWAKEHGMPVLLVGGGSNLIFKGGYEGLVIVNRMCGFQIISEDVTSTTIAIGAGENWDEVVGRSAELGLYGIECMSGIPGCAGSMPVQNAGAYGSEIADTLVELEAFDLHKDSFVKLSKADCKFAYRDSIFKSTADRHYIITSITLKLSKTPPEGTFYESLQKYFDENNITDRAPTTIRKAVLATRATKLPDPAKIANSGSFFKNPVVTMELASKLKSEYPDMPQWPLPTGEVKLPAGWLIERAGLKGYKNHGMETYDKNALILVNRAAKSYADLATFQQDIVSRIYKQFGVTLEQEPELF